MVEQCDNGRSEPVNQWEPNILAFEEYDREHPPAKGAVVLVGSSTIGLWPNPERDFAPVAIVRRGFGGSQMGDVLHYVDRVVLPYEPRTVVVYAGDNDIACGRTAAQVFEAFRSFVEIVHGELPQTGVHCVSIKPSASRAALWDRMVEANRLIRRYAAETEGVGYIDIVPRMLDAAGRTREDLFLADMLHMNAKGYELWTDVIRPVLMGD